MNSQRIVGGPLWRLKIICIFAVIHVYCIVKPTHAFGLTTAGPKNNAVHLSSFRQFDLQQNQPQNYGRATPNSISDNRCRYRRCYRNHGSYRPSSQLSVVSEVALADYAPAAAALFNNMKLPAGVLTAGMISLGFATRFPELPRDSFDKVYPQEQRALCAKLDRLHIVLGLISVTSELIVVLWAAVSVNQLTERAYEPAYSVWDLIHRDCDLAWSAVNSHFIFGIIGFTAMLWLRAYVMLLIAKASNKLVIAASTGTGAALFLMVSVVNRGIASGGGNVVDSYGANILDLVVHYAALLLQAGTNVDSPGPLQVAAIVLEAISLSFMFVVLLTESDTDFEEQMVEEDSCPIDAYEILNGTNGDTEASKQLSSKELNKLSKCIELEDEANDPRKQVVAMEEEEKRRLDDGDSSASVVV